MNTKRLLSSKWKWLLLIPLGLIALGVFLISGTIHTCDPKLDRAFKAWETAGFSGSIAISQNGEFVCLAGYGLADKNTNTRNTADTVFSIGSVSKAFTAVAIFKLIDEGKLSVDTRIGQIFPELSGPISNVTLEQLLLHTSGLKGGHGIDHKPLSRAEALTAISSLEQAFTPGSDYLYSNAGYTLLALVIDKVSGMNYREFIDSRILTLPDGKKSKGFWDGYPAAPSPRAIGYFDDGTTGLSGDFKGPHWAVDGNGDLAMSMQDLASWTYALFSGQILSKKSTAAINRAGFKHDSGNAETPGWVSINPQLYGEPAIVTAGGGGDVGHNVIVAWLPQSKRVIAMASNTPNMKAEELLQTIAQSFIAGSPLPTPPPFIAKVDRKVLSAAAGTYRLKTGSTFTVTVRGLGLAIAAQGPDAIEALFPLPKSVSKEAIRRHEENVLKLLNGKTPEGK